MKVNAGALDRQIDLYKVVQTQDEAGQTIDCDQLIATVYAQRLELRSTDIARMAGKESVSAGRYLIRYRECINSATKARIEDRLYAVTAIDEPDRRQTLVLTLEGLSS